MYYIYIYILSKVRFLLVILVEILLASSNELLTHLESDCLARYESLNTVAPS